MAIRAIPIGILAWGGKVLLLHLHQLAGKHGEPADHVATTQPAIADALGCQAITAGELLDGLERLELLAVVRRLYRGEIDERAPNLRDGGTILRLRRDRIFELAARNHGPTGTRYRPVSEGALDQARARNRELEEELARLREGHASLSAKLDEVLARLGTPQTGVTVEKLPTPRRRRGGGGEGSQGGATGTGGGAGGAIVRSKLHAAHLDSPLRGNHWSSASRRHPTEPCDAANDNAAARISRRAA